MVRRLQESGRRDGSKIGLEGGALKEKGRGKAGNIGMLERRQVTPRWANYHVPRHKGRLWRGCQVRRGIPPPERHQVAGGEVREGQE